MEREAEVDMLGSSRFSKARRTRTLHRGYARRDLPSRVETKDGRPAVSASSRYVQLVVNRDDHALETRPVGKREPQQAPKNPPVHRYEARLGSEDLVELAVIAREEGVKTKRFVFCDTNLQLLDSDTQDEYSEELVAELIEHGRDGVRAKLFTELRGIFVCAVDLYSPTIRAITVNSNGEVKSRNPERTVAFLTPTFQRIGLL
jgi:hypothetical protein